MEGALRAGGAAGAPRRALGGAPGLGAGPGIGGPGPEARLAEELRDVLLRFPCAALEGVRWSALRCAHRERFPGAPPPGAAPGAAAEGAAAAAAPVLEALRGLAEPAPAGAGEEGPRLLLADAAALEPGGDGQLACWPLLVQRLGDIVREHGDPQPAAALGPQLAAAMVASGRSVAAAAAAAGAEEVVGVRLAQLKPLLRRHWDPAFEERAVGFYNEAGSYVSIKKMKHLVAELLRWRARRKALGRATAVDAALELAAPLVLAASASHSDMVLCTPKAAWRARGDSGAPAPGLPPPVAGPAPAAPVAAAPPAAAPACPGAGAGAGGPEARLAAAAPPAAAAGAPPPRPGLDAQRVDALERDCQRLKIENAELKKRLRFGADFLNKEIRRLRIENAELKKRLYVAAAGAAAASPAAASSSATGGGAAAFIAAPHQVWVPAPAFVAPVVGGGGAPAGAAAGAAAAETPPRGNCEPAPGAAAGVPPSGHVSPGQGSLTPIPQGFCYAVPLTPGQPWPSHMGSLVAMPVYGPDRMASGSVMSPTSDISQQMSLLPRSLLSCSEAASSSRQSHASRDADAVSPDGGWWQGAEPRHHGAADVSAMQHQLGPDDRWVCIPSGIVERQKAQFEEHSAAPEGASEEAAPASPSTAGAPGTAAAPAGAAAGAAAGSPAGGRPEGAAAQARGSARDDGGA